MSREDFYQAHLNRVSRSFAFCIANLRTPLKAWVGLSYLICRVLDTVEDAPWAQRRDQLSHFEQFSKFIESKPKKEMVEDWSNNFPKAIPEGEVLLLKDSHRLFYDFHDSPESVKEIIGEMVVSMAQGMRYFAEKKENGTLKLKNLNEVNHYCFFVAGVVGEALAKLVAHVEPQFQNVKSKILDAHHFGLFLQKINLLKDQAVDVAEGREFIYSRDEVKQSLSYNAYGAYRFLISLPYTQREFRLFCAWSLFLGLGSLEWSDQFYQQGQSDKMPKSEAEDIFTRVEESIDDNAKLEVLFAKCLRSAKIDLITEELYQNPSQGESVKTWDHELYEGVMEEKHLNQLGIA